MPRFAAAYNRPRYRFTVSAIAVAFDGGASSYKWCAVACGEVIQAPVWLWQIACNACLVREMVEFDKRRIMRNWLCLNPRVLRIVERSLGTNGPETRARDFDFIRAVRKPLFPILFRKLDVAHGNRGADRVAERAPIRAPDNGSVSPDRFIMKKGRLRIFQPKKDQAAIQTFYLLFLKCLAADEVGVLFE